MTGRYEELFNSGRALKTPAGRKCNCSVVIDTFIEADSLSNNGILPTVFREILSRPTA